jgi:hypothetical protein
MIWVLAKLPAGISLFGGRPGGTCLFDEENTLLAECGVAKSGEI